MEMVATGIFVSPMNNDSNKFIFGRDSVSFTYREAVDALSDQFVGWGGDTHLHPSAPRLCALPELLANIQTLQLIQP